MKTTVIIPCVLATIIGVSIMETSIDDLGLVLGFLLGVAGLVGLYVEVKDIG